jgi:hypothetical protein
VLIKFLPGNNTLSGYKTIVGEEPELVSPGEIVIL